LFWIFILMTTTGINSVSDTYDVASRRILFPV